MSGETGVKRSNLHQRLLAAGILLPLVLAAFIWGPSWFVAIFLIVCLTLSVGELAVILIPAFEHRLGGVTPPTKGSLTRMQLLRLPAVAVGLGAIALVAGAAATPAAALCAVAVGICLALAVGAYTSETIDLAAARSFALLISFCYGSLPWLVVWQLYLLGPHSRYILLVMAVTWSGDTGGYFGGRYLGGKLFGQRRMAPLISPKKTWEGAFFGLLLSIVGGLLLNLFFFNELGSAAFIVKAAFFGGIAAQIGDLIESLCKRFAGVKDSGTIIPGHGGFLDRVDGILFAAPAIWAIVTYLH